jgi:methyl-accepting chemotaxis protein
LIKQFLHEEFLNQGDGNRYVDFLLPVMSYGSGDPSGIFLNKEEVPKQQTIGYIQIGLTQESLRKRIHQFLLTSLMVTSFIVLLGVLLTLLITRKITSPIKKLKLATQDISEGKFDHHIAIETKDEISDLTQSFNHMLEYLRTYQAQIEDRNARMTAANIQMQQEITERRRAEEALRRSARRVRRARRDAPDKAGFRGPARLDIGLHLRTENRNPSQG